jgi:ribosomal protein S18 acetylase RimI-like enzyme
MASISVEHITAFSAADLDDICRATQDAIADGIGFNWVSAPSRDVLESYWKGALLVPQRMVFGCRLDGSLAGSIQLIRPGKHKETSAFACKVESHFVAPWARGHGLAKKLLEAAERQAAKEGFTVMRLSVRASQERARQIYQEAGYIEWGVLPLYEYVNASMVAGHHFYKQLGSITDLV